MNTTAPSKVIGLDNYRVHTDQGEELTSISKLALRLQQSIEITPLMQTFCEETARIVPCDSVNYSEPASNLNFSVGEKQAHHCRYQLVLEGEKLGEIVCSRKKPFSIRETDLLERLLALLIYPLRNALLYHSAIAQAHRDPLTQIGNRAAFDEALNKHISFNTRHKTDFSIMVIDIDHFKKVNDTFGHIAGDKVLKSVADTIQNTLRASDEVFRYGGEEFVVILGNTQQGGANFIAERIRKSIEDLKVSLNKTISVTASIGIAATENVGDVNHTLELADKALYQAKESGRNRVIVYP